ncbi:hypothetical protein ILYODFUR_020884 [Ilyodon furcidens]|uniref:Secreted protein n=1 Tax=Ilyodon furcidens TaxID=33524 RepID=A0ABV0V5R8_9TELE
MLLFFFFFSMWSAELHGFWSIVSEHRWQQTVSRQDVCTQDIVWPSCSAAPQNVFIQIFTYCHSVHKGSMSFV